jgi:hypothetical protein
MLMTADMPSISKSRDHGELQDMYRRALAASWAAHAGELPADQCVEDIFNGGDGWKDKRQDKDFTSRMHEDSASDEHSRLHHHTRTKSGGSSKSQSTITGNRMTRMGHKHSNSRETIGRSPGTASPANDTSSENSERGRTGFKKAHEVDEFDVREDLVAWRLPATVS